MRLGLHEYVQGETRLCMYVMVEEIDWIVLLDVYTCVRPPVSPLARFYPYWGRGGASSRSVLGAYPHSSSTSYKQEFSLLRFCLLKC